MEFNADVIIVPYNVPSTVMIEPAGDKRTNRQKE